jgi:LmbE family N-acetylglucosaminyl deacetylase
MVRSITSGRVVLISPHLDDAVLSLGATIVRLVGRGVHVDVLSVFGCDPSSTHPSCGWDRRAGFSSEGAAAAARREEDREACRIVGAKPIVLGYRGGAYGGPDDPEPTWRAIAEVVSGADVVLVPGFPLTNDDHRWLSTLLVERRLPAERLGLYAEQPYRYAFRRRLSTVTLEHGGEAESWVFTGSTLRELRAKRRAILAYRSQMKLLGFTAKHHRKLNRMLLHELVHRGEAIAELHANSA